MIWKAILGVAGIIISSAFFWQLFEKLPKGFPEIVFLQTTDGDAIFIKTPHGKEIVIDGGIDHSVLSALSKHRLFWDTTINLLVVTHPDADHYYGALEILKRFSVENMLITGVLKNDPKYAEMLQLAQQKKTNIIIAHAENDIEIDGMLFDIVSPDSWMYGSKELATNNEAIVIKVRYQNHSLLLTSDIEEKTEKLLLSKGINLSAEVLKIAHHGSKTSSSQSFLQAVRPKLAIITVGTKNRFGHPHQITIERLNAMNIPWKNTKIDGDIVLKWKNEK